MGEGVFTIRARLCKRCGRLLTSEEALKSGYGCQCAKKASQEEKEREPMPGQRNIFDYIPDPEGRAVTAGEGSGGDAHG